MATPRSSERNAVVKVMWNSNISDSGKSAKNKKKLLYPIWLQCMELEPIDGVFRSTFEDASYGILPDDIDIVNSCLVTVKNGKTLMDTIPSDPVEAANLLKTYIRSREIKYTCAPARRKNCTSWKEIITKELVLPNVYEYCEELRDQHQLSEPEYHKLITYCSFIANRYEGTDIKLPPKNKSKQIRELSTSSPDDITIENGRITNIKGITIKNGKVYTRNMVKSIPIRPITRKNQRWRVANTYKKRSLITVIEKFHGSEKKTERDTTMISSITDEIE